MIQKKTLKEAIQNPEIISVVGELLPIVTSSKNGLCPSGMPFVLQDTTNNNANLLTGGTYLQLDGTSVANLPDNNVWNLTVQRNNASDILQKAWRNNAGTLIMMSRAYVGGTWSRWG